MTDHHASPKLHRDPPPDAPVPWFDPDPLTVEVEQVERSVGRLASDVDELHAAWRSWLVRLALVALLLILVGLAAAQLGRA